MRHKAWRWQTWIAAGWLACCGLSLAPMAQADVRYKLTAPDGQPIVLTGVNQKRVAESLILYTPEYGATTHTNPYGVEVAAAEVPGKPQRYKVQQIRSVFTCQSENNLSQCGNMPIPDKGIVLSAMGSKRDLLLKTFLPGAEFELTPTFYTSSAFPLAILNPTPETNPLGAGFPGFRGGNQLVIYDVNYGQPSTGTNEFGFEVTVKNGRVIRQEGANSTLPPEPDTFVLSGHGRARQWLIDNAPVGAKITVQDGSVISEIDQEAALIQLEQITERIRALNKTVPEEMNRKIQTLRETRLQMSESAFIQQVDTVKEKLTRTLWASYPAVAPTAMRAVWHRPSESSLKAVRQSLDKLKQAGINTLYLETYLHGDPIFPSSTFASYNIPQKPPFKLADSTNQDLLKIWLDEAHKRGIKVHVWFQTFYAGNVQYDKTKGAILAAYPAWANIQRSALDKPTLPPSTLEPGSYFLDPANQDVQNFLLRLIDEIVTNYDIDGFQLDYIRYPSSFPVNGKGTGESTWGYTPTARNIFLARFGMDPAELLPAEQPALWTEWQNFKTQQVDRFVEKAYRQIRSRRPQLPISAAVFPKPVDALGRKHQNWQLWGQSGWVDFFAPMTLTSSLQTIAADTQIMRNTTALPVVTGIFGPFNGNAPTDVLDQVWTAMQAGAVGVSLFDTAHLTQKMVEALQAGIFQSQNKPVSK